MIKSARMRQALSLQDIADLLSVDKSYAYRAEMGQRHYTPKMLKEYARITKCNYNSLARYEIDARVTEYETKLRREYYGDDNGRTKN